VLTPRKVPPNNTAPTRAAVTPETKAGNAIPADCNSNATTSSVGWDHRVLAMAHAAADGAAANPTSRQAALPSVPCELCPIAATRNVPAMM